MSAKRPQQFEVIIALVGAGAILAFIVLLLRFPVERLVAQLSPTFRSVSEIAEAVTIVATVVAIPFLNSFMRKVHLWVVETVTPQEVEPTKLAIIEMFAAKCNRRVQVSSALILCLIFLGLLASLSGRVHKAYYLVGAVAIVLLWSDHLILAYRIKRGYYSTNQHEARELLRFLIQHADKTNFSDGDGLRKIFPTPEEIAARSRVGAHLPGYAEA